MSKLKELIQKYCSNGVEIKELKEICNISIGEFVHKNKQREDALYPVFNGGTTNTGFYDEYNNEGNKILISARGANAGFVNKIQSRYWAGNSCYSLDVKDENSVNWLYVFYYLKNNEKKLLGQQQTGSIPAISKKQIESFKIAVPPLEVQCEIVHILDDFTLLSAELSAELKARVEQYEYYRDTYFEKMDSKYEKIKLKDIVEIQRGGNFQKRDYIEQGSPCIHYGQIYTIYNLYTDKVCSYIPENVYKKQKIAHKNDIIMAVTSENMEDVCKAIAWLGEEDIAVSGHSAIITHKQNPKYLSYFFQSKLFQEQKKKFARGVKVVEFQPFKLNEIEIALPPLEIQEKVVQKLEKFFNLTTNISDGLPAEIEERQIQYEYYRNKLLNFKEVRK